MTDRPRLPPGQRLTTDFPVLHLDRIPRFDPNTWDLRVKGEIENTLRFTWDELLQLPRAESVSDFHCVTTWSRFDNRWEGVLLQTIARLARPRATARFVTAWAEGDYTTSLPLADMIEPDVLLAYRWAGKPLPPEHGGPLRLVVPQKYAYKAVKWLRGLRFTSDQELGYWEQRGYSNSADPWKEERHA